jgi:predicted ArsR family transcriptional regulator
MYAGIPQAAQRFLRRCIMSVGQLEVFLLLAGNPDRWWSCDDIADELRASPVAARRALQELVSAYLLEFTGVGPAALFRFKPADPSLDELVPLLAQLHRHRLTALAAFIHDPDHAVERPVPAHELNYRLNAVGTEPTETPGSAE